MSLVEPDSPGSPSRPAPRVSRRLARALYGGAALLVLGLVLAAGAGGWWIANRTIVASSTIEVAATDAASTPTFAGSMPDIRGLSGDDAAQALADAGFSAAVITFVETPSAAPAGIVVGQVPQFGTSNPASIKVLIAAPATTPDLIGVARETAVTTLTDLGASISITLVYRSDLRVGDVVSTSPAAGVALPSSVVLEVASAGADLPLREVERLSGNCKAEAEVSIGGTEHADSIVCGTEPDARSTTWFLQGKVGEFSATVGVDDRGAPGAAAVVEVLADGVVVATERAVFGSATPIILPMAGVQQLSVRVTSTSADAIILGSAVVRGSADAIAELQR